MTEHGQSEESEQTRVISPSDMLEELVSHFPAGSLRRTTFYLHFRDEGGNPPDITVDLEAGPAQAKAEAGQALVKTSEALLSAFEDHVPVERDDAYYDELRQAIGRGAPTALLGASTKSLERGLKELRDLQQPKPTQPESGPRSKPRSESSTEGSRSSPLRRPTHDEPPSRTAVHIWEAVKLVVWVIAGLSILSLALITSEVWSDSWNAFLLIASAVLWTTLSVIVYVGRHAAERWVDRQLAMMRDRRGRGHKSTTEHSGEKAESKKH